MQINFIDLILLMNLILQNYFLNEIFSPLITPFLLLFVFRPKALEIVKFFRSFTVSVRGVGNVCSFAQMDVRKHGNPEWQIENICQSNNNTNGENENKVKCSPLENGKTELSLIRFTLMNPEWQMPPVALSFVNDVRQHALADFSKANNEGVYNENALTESLVSFGTIKDEVFEIYLITNDFLNSFFSFCSILALLDLCLIVII